MNLSLIFELSDKHQRRWGPNPFPVTAPPALNLATVTHNGVLNCIIKAVRQAPTLHDELRLIQTLSENVASVSHCRGAQEWTADSHTAEIIKNLRGRRDSSGRRTAKQNIADFHSHIGVTTLQETLK